MSRLPAPPSPPRVRLTSALCVLALVIAVVGFGVLRGFNTETPRLFPGPLGSTLLVALAALAVVHAVDRRRGRDLFGSTTAYPGLNLPRTLPLLIVVVGEKWLSVELLADAYDWTEGYFLDESMRDACYRLFSGLTLLATSLGFLWVLRQSRRRLRRLVRPRRLIEAAALFVAGAGITVLLVLGVALSAGPLRFGILNVSTDVLAVAISAQLVRAAAEELYYRGLLQVTLNRLMELAGLPAGRPAQIAAILLVSAGFTLEHYGAAGSVSQSLRLSLYVFAMSCGLGALLVASRNLYLVVATHAAINLLVGLMVPMPVANDMQPLLPPDIVVMWLLVLLFSGVAIAYRVRAGAGAGT